MPFGQTVPVEPFKLTKQAKAKRQQKQQREAQELRRRLEEEELRRREDKRRKKQEKRRRNKTSQSISTQTAEHTAEHAPGRVSL